MKTIQDLQAELKQLQNKINTSIANGEYSPDMPMWREGVRKILEELKNMWNANYEKYYNKVKNAVLSTKSKTIL